MANDQSLKTTFQRMVPFYLNDTLSVADMMFFKEMLALNPEWQTLVDFDAQIQKSVVQQTVPISAEASYTRFSAQQRARPTSWWKSLYFGFVYTYSTPIVSVCLIVMIGQFLYISNMSSFDDTNQFRSWRILQTKQAQYKLFVKPEVKFNEVVRLLQETHCQIVSGPNENGELIVNCQSNSVSIQTIFEKSPLLNDVLPVK